MNAWKLELDVEPKTLKLLPTGGKGMVAHRRWKTVGMKLQRMLVAESGRNRSSTRSPESTIAVYVTTRTGVQRTMRTPLDECALQRATEAQ